MINNLFVCLGNICRSPLAHGILLKEINDRNLQNIISVDSCGTSQYHIGEQPDSRTRANAELNGVWLNHQARQFERADFRKFDYILAMDRANYKNVIRLDQTSEFEHKVHLMRDFDPLDKGADVPDPYVGGEQGFQHVFDILDRSVDDFLNWVIDQHKLKT